MSIRIGLYEFFAYTVPGVVYLLIAGFAASIFGLLPITWQALNDLSLTSLALLVGAGYVVGYLMDYFAYKWTRLFRPKSTAARSLQVFQRYYPAVETNFTSYQWGILLRSLKQSSIEAAADIEQFNATSIMLRNVSFGLVLWGVVFVAYFILVSRAFGNLFLALACLVASIVAAKVSARFRNWFYLSVYEGMAAHQLGDVQWFKVKTSNSAGVYAPDCVTTTVAHEQDTDHSLQA